MKIHTNYFRKYRLLLAALPCLALAVDRAAAELIAYEPFDYGRVQWYASDSVLGEGIAGLAGGIGWAGAWTSRGSKNAGIPVYPDDYPAGSRVAPLVYTDGFGHTLQTSGSQIRTAFGNNSWDQRLLSEPIGELGSTIWVSFLAQSDGIATASPRYAFVELENSGTSNPLWLGKVTPNTTGNWGIQMQNAPVTSADFGDDAKMDLQTFFVMKLEFPDAVDGQTGVSVWLNPLDLTDESALSTPVFSGTMQYSIWDQVGVRGRYSTDFDEIRIGTSFASVAPVPEPASGFLFGLSMLGGLLWWWRQRSR